MQQRWYPEYQERDKDIVDYQEFRVDGCDVPFRGPALDPFSAPQGSFFSCLGAAQTYGCYYKPFPTMVAENIKLKALNLGVGGAGPGFYTQYPRLIEAMNRGRFVILQCMAARHESNSRFEADGYVEFLRERKSGESVSSNIAWKRIVTEEMDQAERYVAETRQSWIETSRKLVSMIKVPVIFFWYSRRQRDYIIDYDAIADQNKRRTQGKDDSHFVDGLTGDFPHLIDGATSWTVASMCDAYAECFSSRGMGQPLINRFTGKPCEILPSAGDTRPEWHARRIAINDYYPSAEMHEDATQALLPVVRRLMEIHKAP